jgi:hypothetical protein
MRQGLPEPPVAANRRSAIKMIFPFLQNCNTITNAHMLYKNFLTDYKRLALLSKWLSSTYISFEHPHVSLQIFLYQTYCKGYGSTMRQGLPKPLATAHRHSTVETTSPLLQNRNTVKY